MKTHKVPEGFYARVGDFFGPIKDSPSLAVKALDEEIEKYRPLNHVYVRANDGHVLHIFGMPSHGWNINIIGPNGYKGKGIGVRGTFQEAKQKAIEFAEKHGGVIL